MITEYVKNMKLWDMSSVHPRFEALQRASEIWSENSGNRKPENPRKAELQEMVGCYNQRCSSNDRNFKNVWIVEKKFSCKQWEMFRAKISFSNIFWISLRNAETYSEKKLQKI